MQLVGDEEGMWLDTTPRGAEEVEVASKLKDLAGRLPAGELAPDITRISVSGQEQTAAKEGQISDRLQELMKSHGINMP